MWKNAIVTAAIMKVSAPSSIESAEHVRDLFNKIDVMVWNPGEDDDYEWTPFVQGC